MNKDKLVCQDCGSSEDDVKETSCPFMEDVYNRLVEIIVCDLCYRERLYDI